jgi:hypothetical protein
MYISLELYDCVIIRTMQYCFTTSPYSCLRTTDGSAPDQVATLGTYDPSRRGLLGVCAILISLQLPNTNHPAASLTFVGGSSMKLGAATSSVMKLGNPSLSAPNPSNSCSSPNASNSASSSASSTSSGIS